MCVSCVVLVVVIVVVAKHVGGEHCFGLFTQQKMEVNGMVIEVRRFLITIIDS